MISTPGGGFRETAGRAAFAVLAAASTKASPASATLASRKASRSASDVKNRDGHLLQKYPGVFRL